MCCSSGCNSKTRIGHSNCYCNPKHDKHLALPWARYSTDPFSMCNFLVCKNKEAGVIYFTRACMFVRVCVCVCVILSFCPFVWLGASTSTSCAVECRFNVWAVMASSCAVARRKRRRWRCYCCWCWCERVCMYVSAIGRQTISQFSLVSN